MALPLHLRAGHSASIGCLLALVPGCGGCGSPIAGGPDAAPVPDASPDASPPGDAGLDAAPDDGGIDAGPPPLQGWFLFAGGAERGPRPDAPHCVYRLRLGGVPEPLFCTRSGYPRPGTFGYLSAPGLNDPQRVVAGTYALPEDGYPEFGMLYEASIEEVRVLDASDGEAPVFTHHLENPSGGPPVRKLLGGLLLNDDRLAIVRQTNGVHPDFLVATELVVVDRAGMESSDLLPAFAEKRLIGRLASGEVLVEAAHGGGDSLRRLVAVDPIGGGTRLIGEGGDSFYQAIAPDGEHVAFGFLALGSSEPRVVVWSARGEVASRAGDDLDVLGWSSRGEVLLVPEGGRRIVVWDALGTGADREEAAPDGLRVARLFIGSTGSGFELSTRGTFVSPSRSDTALVLAPEEGRPSAVALLGDGAMTILCDGLPEIRSLDWVQASSAPEVVAGLDDGGGSDHNRIVLCRAGAPPVELLAEHHLRGQLLGYPQFHD